MSCLLKGVIYPTAHSRPAPIAGLRTGIGAIIHSPVRSSIGASAFCYTRTGRRFFDDRSLESQFLERIKAAFGNSGGLWDELGSDWACLDCELIPCPQKLRNWSGSNTLL